MGGPCVHILQCECIEIKGARDREGGRWRHVENSERQSNVGVASWNVIVPESPPLLLRGEDKEFPLQISV